ncbi:histidine phosphatase family protein [Humibacillus xanthopallidus]|uniref:Putative phosphoglycerate mutase n=1 Tax=Humibacillus xanthopallidus TaxID=412689 RepID=A0A543HJM3_9MICO|nr:histidine phosphatase family protein [Humibacillus xanthopallidus]TQM58538.1 putative phosphoglycerate mutase [Humibacillus xanthopallidus]
MSLVPGGPRPRRIVVMRHAETVDNAARVWQGHRDSALSDRGEQQVAAAAPHVAAYGPVVIVSSDLRRAVSTAEAVGELTGLPVRLDERLREVHVGEWQGLHVDDVHERYPEIVAALDRGEDVPKGVTGETRQDVAARAGAALREVADGLGDGETALVVAHGVSARVAASDLVGLDQDVSDRVFRGLDNCHWVELVEAGKSFSATARWRIAGWNLGPWKA